MGAVRSKHLAGFFPDTKPRGPFRFIRGLTIAAAGFIAVAAAPLSPAQAWTLTTLYSFCQKVSCADGEQPAQSLVMDQAGNLYGVAAGGAHNHGVAFALLADPNTGTWKYKVLYHFCALQNCTDGRDPAGPL